MIVESGESRRLAPRAALSVALFALSLGCLVFTLHWPMVGDAALIRYDSFLISRGEIPYRDFFEINLPGCFATDWLVRHLFGDGSLAWRIFDWTLTLGCDLGMLFTLGWREWRSATIAAALFAVAHWGDGIAQLGQRDLQIAFLLIAGIAAWVSLESSTPAKGAFLFGVLHGYAFVTKPNSLLVTVCCLVVLLANLHGARKSLIEFACWMSTGFLLPCLGVVLYLSAHGALQQFWFTLRVLLPFHASLARRGLPYLLVHSLAPYAVLVYLWLAVSVLTRSKNPPGDARRLLVAASIGGLAMYVAQAKGFPYHRYPFFVFLLPLISLDCASWLRSGPPVARVVAVLGLGIFVVGVCPLSLVRIARFDSHDRFGESLRRDLRAFPQLDGRVQCLDSVQGCIATLDSLRLVQSTGLIYDEFLFGDSRAAAVTATRTMFTRGLEAHPPEVFIVVDSFFLDSSTGYQKLNTWPNFSDWLNAHYQLAVDRPSPGPVRWWGRPQPAPGYRLYVLREPHALPEQALR